MSGFNYGVGVAIVAIVSGFIYVYNITHPPIRSFEDCEKAGYPIAESYPRQCWTPEGTHFIEFVIP